MMRNTTCPAAHAERPPITGRGGDAERACHAVPRATWGSGTQIMGAAAILLGAMSGAAQADQLAFQCSMFADVWPQPELGSYDYTPVGADFTYYETQTVPETVGVIVLEHCPSRQSLRVFGTPEISQDVRLLVDDLVFGPAPYTFAQMADAIRPLGVTANIYRSQADSCACQIESGANPEAFLE
jgi:hypothetical protein